MNPVNMVISVVVLALACANAVAQPASESIVDGTTQRSQRPTNEKAVDRKIQKDVRRALSKDMGVAGGNIVIRANGGNVTLSGTVSDEVQREKASQIAHQISGVGSVKNLLTIRQTGR